MNRYIERTEMKLLAATVISISLLSSASAQTTQEGTASGSVAVQAVSVQERAYDFSYLSTKRHLLPSHPSPLHQPIP
jgi:hypothetical protein